MVGVQKTSISPDNTGKQHIPILSLAFSSPGTVPVYSDKFLHCHDPRVQKRFELLQKCTVADQYIPKKISSSPNCGLKESTSENMTV